MIGESPGTGYPDEPVLGGRFSKKMAKVMSIEEPIFLSMFIRSNLIDFPVKDWNTASRILAKHTISLVEPFLDQRIVFLAGRRVAAEFGVVDVDYYREVAHMKTLPCGNDVTYGTIVIPHPSGRNRWWNDRNNTAEAKRFWRDWLWQYVRGGHVLGNHKNISR